MFEMMKSMMMMMVTVIHPDSQLSFPLSFHSSEIESNLGNISTLQSKTFSLLSNHTPDSLLPSILREYGRKLMMLFVPTMASRPEAEIIPRA